MHHTPAIKKTLKTPGIELFLYLPATLISFFSSMVFDHYTFLQIVQISSFHSISYWFLYWTHNKSFLLDLWDHGLVNGKLLRYIMEISRHFHSNQGSRGILVTWWFIYWLVIYRAICSKCMRVFTTNICVVGIKVNSLLTLSSKSLRFWYPYLRRPQFFLYTPPPLWMRSQWPRRPLCSLCETGETLAFVSSGTIRGGHAHSHKHRLDRARCWEAMYHW